MIGEFMEKQTRKKVMANNLASFGKLKTNNRSKSMKRSKPKKTAHQNKVGTTSGATQLSWAVAQSFDGVANPNSSVQIDRHLNIVNRRLYRQHKVYTAKVKLSNPNADQRAIGVFALRNTWAVRKAISTAKTVFDQAVSEERAQVGNARWQDFRILTDGVQMWNQSKGTLPFSVNGPSAEYRPYSEGAVGEYDYSAVATTDANGVEQIKGFDLAPASTPLTYSIFDEYNRMGPKTSASPLSPSPGGYDRARGTDFEDANVLELLGDGNNAPYNPENLGLDSVWVKVGEIGRSSTGGMVTSTPYFEAPLGIVVLQGYSAQAASGLPIPVETQLVEVCVKEGDYKGVTAYDI